VVDASVTAAWFLGNQSNPYTIAVFKAVRSSDKVYVPALWSLEVLNTLLVAERRKLISEGDVRMAIDELTGMPIQLDHGPVDLFSDDIEYLARKFGRSAYDASYLELALRMSLPLATKDGPLRQAAEAAGVALFDPLA
jgi:predicted nucleic acid-binding protein